MPIITRLVVYVAVARLTWELDIISATSFNIFFFVTIRSLFAGHGRLPTVICDTLHHSKYESVVVHTYGRYDTRSEPHTTPKK